MSINTLVGKTIKDIIVDRRENEIKFITDEGEYLMYHEQDCCESVIIEDINGDINDLMGMVLGAEKRTNIPGYNEGLIIDFDSVTWTFYRIWTRKGMVVIRWWGESNGYYSEEVSFDRKTKK